MAKVANIVVMVITAGILVYKLIIFVANDWWTLSQWRRRQRLWKKSSGYRNASVSFKINSPDIGYLKDSTEYSDKLYDIVHKQQYN